MIISSKYISKYFYDKSDKLARKLILRLVLTANLLTDKIGYQIINMKKFERCIKLIYRIIYLHNHLLKKLSKLN